jgi:hypothetical protein
MNKFGADKRHSSTTLNRQVLVPRSQIAPGGMKHASLPVWRAVENITQATDDGLWTIDTNKDISAAPPYERLHC